MMKLSEDILNEEARTNILPDLSNRLNERLGRKNHAVVLFYPEKNQYMICFHLPSDELCFLVVYDDDGMLDYKANVHLLQLSVKDRRFIQNVFHVGATLLCEEPLYRLPFLTGTLTIKENDIY